MANQTTSKRNVKLRANILAYLSVLLYPFVFLFALLVHAIERLWHDRHPKSFANDVAVITGGAQGLGKAIGMKLASQGCHIAVVDINQTLAEETAKEIRQNHKVKATAYKVDVSDYLQVEELRSNVEQDLGPATVLVNNAAILMLKDPIKPDWQDVQRMINVNLSAHFWTKMVFLPTMKKLRRGHIVAISSASSFFPLIYNSEYTSTKFAVRGLMRVLRLELKTAGHNGIGTTTVFPSFLSTNDEVAQIIRKTGTEAVFPLISGEEAAEAIVSGMSRNIEELILPNFLGIQYRCIETFPSAWQDRFLLIPARLFKMHQKLFIR